MMMFDEMMIFEFDIVGGCWSYIGGWILVESSFGSYWELAKVWFRFPLCSI